MRTQCGSWPNSISLSGNMGLANPRLSGCQSLPPSSVSNTPPDDRPMYMWLGFRRSCTIECNIEPSGVFCSGHSAHVSHSGWSFHPSTVVHVSPLSSVRKRPCGDPPAYQTPGWLAAPGESQKTDFRLRCNRSPVRNAGGMEASRQVDPPSLERKTLGPR